MATTGVSSSEVEGGATIHLTPKNPENTGDIDHLVELKEEQEYVLDGRVKQANLGVAWTATDVDVDVSLAVYDDASKCVDLIWWDKKYSRYVSAQLLNDDRTGAKVNGSDVNETISIDFAKVPREVHYMSVILTVYSKGKNFADVSDIMTRLSYTKDNGDSCNLFSYKVGSFESSAIYMGVFRRHECWWAFTALGKEALGRTVKEVIFNMHTEEISPAPAKPGKTYHIYAKVLEGKNLAAADRPAFGKSSSDCYAEVLFKDRRSVSEVIMKNLNPQWKMQKFDLGITDEADCDFIECNIWDHDTTSEDDFLGSVYVRAGGVCQQGSGKYKHVANLGPSMRQNICTRRGLKITGEITIDFYIEEVIKTTE